MKTKQTAPRTELEKSLKRVDASDALASIAEASQKPRVLIWESEPGKWSRYAVKENDLKLGFAETFDTAMKRAKNKFPAARVDHDSKMTDAKARALKKKFEAVVEAAGGKVQGKGAEVIKPGKGKGKGPGKEPTVREDASKAEQVKDLLDELRAATDPDEKKRIRRKLRARGHRGGLGAERPVPTASKAKVKATRPDIEPDDEDDEDMDDDD